MKSRMFILLLSTLLLGSCSHKSDSSLPAPVRVRTTVVTASSLATDASYVGVVEENAATAVSFTSMGSVQRIAVREGQTVSRGQLIAEMDDTQARNMMSAAEAQVMQADDAFTRYKQLHDAGSLTEAQWVEIQSKVAQAHSQLAIARKNLADCQLTAPVAGIIGRKFVNAGETAMPSQAVATILDISTVKVKFSVPEGEMTTLHTDTPTRITVEAVGRTFSGGSLEKGVQADALTHTYDVRVPIMNNDRTLLPGMVASVSVQSSATDAALTLPLTAVQRRADGSLFLWTVAADSTARRTTVEVGEVQGNQILITRGVTAGTRVVTEGYQKLSEGTHVVF